MGLQKIIPYLNVSFMEKLQIGEKLGKILADKNLSAYALARKMNVPEKTVYSWLKPDANPQIQNLKAVADALEVTVGYITDYGMVPAIVPGDKVGMVPRQISKLLEMTKEVLMSDEKRTRNALKSNIKEFHNTVLERKRARLNAQIREAKLQEARNTPSKKLSSGAETGT